MTNSTPSESVKIQPDWFLISTNAQTVENNFINTANHKLKYLNKYLAAVRDKYNAATDIEKRNNEISSANEFFDKSLEGTFDEILNLIKGSGKKPSWLDFYYGAAPSSITPPIKEPNLLNDKITITEKIIRSAAITCGYGLIRPSSRSASSKNKFWSDREFLNHWRLRVDFALSFIDIKTLTPYKFSEWIESSEKVAPSYIIGSIFSSIVAKKWIEIQGKKMDGYFHLELISESLISGSIDFFNEKNSNLTASVKVPDYIALIKARNPKKLELQVFEAKGGAESYRNEAVKKGTYQITALPLYASLSGYLGSKRGNISSRSVVFTKFEANSEIKVSLYDPPSDGQLADSRPSSENQSPDNFIFQIDLARILLREFSHNLFTSLPEEEFSIGEFRWRKFGDGYLGISSHTYPELAQEALEVYRLAKESIQEAISHISRNFESRAFFRRTYTEYKFEAIHNYAFTILPLLFTWPDAADRMTDRFQVEEARYRLNISPENLNEALKYLIEINTLRWAGEYLKLNHSENWLPRFNFKPLDSREKEKFFRDPMGKYLWAVEPILFAGFNHSEHILRKCNVYEILNKALNPSDLLLRILEKIDLNRIEKNIRTKQNLATRRLRSSMGEKDIIEIQGGLFMADNSINPNRKAD